MAPYTTNTHPIQPTIYSVQMHPIQPTIYSGPIYSVNAPYTTN